MPSNRLSKVQKHITKKKGNKALHENSRDTQRLQSASARDDKLNRVASARQKQNRPYLLRIKTFQSYTTEHRSAFSIPEIQAIIEDYLGRDDEELATLKSDRRPGRPPSTRDTLLQQKQAAEQGEYTSGFWVPDLEDFENLKTLKEWNGQWSSLSTLSFARISKDGVKRESSFPPKGMS
ncbi:translation machinery-associated protein 16 [Massariosphaeria phaeospora]|uniref:Translation machinery-associated protein 16 n=1 Tax=Massariosphaeria phaeospora TaxID=100035 RepID=A0A7C8M5K4_9PLEO|nr:translation machinery-associated protein 16 [Massariosphaeria phaeospora]